MKILNTIYSSARLILTGCLGACLLTACADNAALPSVPDEGSVIHIGGVEVNDTESVSVSAGITKAAPLTTDAADVCESWLKEPLFEGWDVVYWLKANGYAAHRIAKVTLQKEGVDDIKRDDKGFPDYTFKYRTDGQPESSWPDALWHGDGIHIFRGEYAPEALYTPASLPSDITTDQNKTVNYDLLSHYLSMGPNCEITASVARTNLPYRHRLARLMLYVLIDPSLKNADDTRATIKGYQLIDGKDDPSTSAIEFTNIKLLSSVTKTDDVELTGHSTFEPVWTEESNQIIPHSLGEFGSIDEHGHVIAGCEDNCIAFYDDYRETYIIPSNKRWAHYHAMTPEQIAANDTITKIEYGKVPCYDIIVRPTYTKTANVMYDEDPLIDFSTLSNAFDVKISLSNGLTHTSHIVFNLDANFQLAAYILVNREEIDYEESHSETWVEKVHKDGWYGVDNELGHTLSKAGSSWQRAFRIGSHTLDGCGDDEVTDGNFYDKDTGGDKEGAGQYLSLADWKAYFQAAVSGGDHHGDYFILDQDITLDGGIEFTGHLDAQGHTITFSAPLAGLNGNYSTAQESDESATWEANVHKENGSWVPWKTTDFGYRAEIINAVIAGSNFVPMTGDEYDASVTGYIYNCRKNTLPVEWYPVNMKAIPQY